MTGDPVRGRHSDSRSTDPGRFEVVYTYQVVCADNYVGSNCVCIPSETFDCGGNGEIVCREGYVPNPSPSAEEGPCQEGMDIHSNTGYQ